MTSKSFICFSQIFRTLYLNVDNNRCSTVESLAIFGHHGESYQAIAARWKSLIIQSELRFNFSTVWADGEISRQYSTNDGISQDAVHWRSRVHGLERNKWNRCGWILDGGWRFIERFMGYMGLEKAQKNYRTSSEWQVIDYSWRLTVEMY